METIVGVAVRYKNKIYTLLAPNRHHDVIKEIHNQTGDMNIVGEQGFITNTERFLDRQDAARLAFVNGQIQIFVHELFSENLW